MKMIINIIYGQVNHMTLSMTKHYK